MTVLNGRKRGTRQPRATASWALGSRLAIVLLAAAICFPPQPSAAQRRILCGAGSSLIRASATVLSGAGATALSGAGAAVLCGASAAVLCGASAAARSANRHFRDAGQERGDRRQSGQPDGQLHGAPRPGRAGLPPAKLGRPVSRHLPAASRPEGRPQPDPHPRPGVYRAPGDRSGRGTATGGLLPHGAVADPVPAGISAGARRLDDRRGRHRHRPGVGPGAEAAAFRAPAAAPADLASQPPQTYTR